MQYLTFEDCEGAGVEVSREAGLGTLGETYLTRFGFTN